MTGDITVEPRLFTLQYLQICGAVLRGKMNTISLPQDALFIQKPVTDLTTERLPLVTERPALAT